MLPEMAVAAKGEVRSILVLAKKPIEHARRIALDTNSRSSVALTRLLCSGFWRIAPEFVDAPPDPAAMLAEADAALVIGDPALRVRLKVDALAAKVAGGKGLRCGRRIGPHKDTSSPSPASTRSSSTTSPAVARDDRQALRAGRLGGPARSHHARSRRRFPGLQGVWPRAHRRNRRRRGPEARSAAARRSNAICATTSISRSTPKISQGWSSISANAPPPGLIPPRAAHRIRPGTARRAKHRAPDARREPLSWATHGAAKDDSVAARSARSVPVR